MDNIEEFFMSPICVVGTMIGYVVILQVLQQVMASRPEMGLKAFSAFHNFFLCIWSLVMASGVAWNAYHSIVESGWRAIVLDSNAKQWEKFARKWLFIWYVSKYYELIDTIILVLKKKKLIFLHVYHHAIMILVPWLWLKYQWTFTWYAVFVNSSVHVLMYYYYFSTIACTAPWWKKYVTQFQILQFLSIFVVIFLWYYLCKSSSQSWDSFLSDINTPKQCSGSPLIVSFSLFVNTSFLILFGNFFDKTYAKKRN
ncbi:steroid isomerase [Reticulomyxa filosa]|uniref:Elongation of fatty acids protein n=1 Tax=Reticulomyxa filosa TaxID=46433 RepID=X6MME1_RETFI|nr:steroid isomerase [Reticulomyxa filosa]|eukprot:ETO14607.1 steroid isomerase [Reticulomyxa filosa]